MCGMVVVPLPKPLTLDFALVVALGIERGFSPRLASREAAYHSAEDGAPGSVLARWGVTPE